VFFLNIINVVINSSFTRWEERYKRGADEKCTEDVGGESKEERPLRKPKCRWELNIYVNYQGLTWLSVSWIRLAQVRGMWPSVVNTINTLFS